MTYEPDGIRTIPCGLLGKNFEALTPTRSPLSSFEQENSKNKNATNNKFFFILYMHAPAEHHFPAPAARGDKYHEGPSYIITRIGFRVQNLGFT